MLYKSALLTQASGSIGGITFSHNSGGMYVRARTIPTDPNTPDQAVIRSAFGTLVQRWRETLTPFQRINWRSYAANVPIINPLGDTIFISAQNHYIRSNVPRIQLVTPVIDDAPGIFDTGNLSTVSITNISEATQQLDVNFTDADLWNLANGHLIVQQSAPQNLTVNFFRGPYRHLGSVNGVAATPVTLPLVIPAVAGQRLFFRLRATYPDGRLTQAQTPGPSTVIA